MKLQLVGAFLFLGTPSLFAQATNAPAAAPLNLPEPVQVDVTSLLDARVVATCANGQVAPIVDLDGAGGVATAAAVAACGIDNPHVVPGDGTFAANAEHPKVVLHFSDADATGNQVRRMGKPDEFSFAVPPKNYAKMFLFFTSGASGPAKLHFTLTYQDGTKEERDEVCPDWWKDLDGTNPDCVYLISNLAKWGKKNKIAEKDHHNILALDIHPAPEKVLTQVTVKKTHPLVCFWGATGQPAK